jgi:hypothetical protein
LPKYQPEWGLHVVSKLQMTNRNLVHTSEVLLEDYEPPKELEKRGSILHQEVRREYDRNQGIVEDLLLKEKFPMNREDFKLALQQAIEKLLTQNARALLEE